MGAVKTIEAGASQVEFLRDDAVGPVSYDSAMNARLLVRREDITGQRVDAIVNAANPALEPGGGVCGAIHHAAGRELEEACARIGGCPTGEARITPGFRLPARWVIHAVGPVWSGGARGEPELLAGCYRHAFALARTHEIRSIAFPSISTGIYGYPVEQASRIAMREMLTALADDPRLQQVIAVCFDARTERAYHGALEEAERTRC